MINFWSYGGISLIYSTIVTPSPSLITKLALLTVNVFIILFKSLRWPSVAFGTWLSGLSFAHRNRCIKFLKLTVSITDSVKASSVTIKQGLGRESQIGE